MVNEIIPYVYHDGLIDTPIGKLIEKNMYVLCGMADFNLAPKPVQSLFAIVQSCYIRRLMILRAKVNYLIKDQRDELVVGFFCCNKNKECMRLEMMSYEPY